MEDRTLLYDLAKSSRPGLKRTEVGEREEDGHRLAQDIVLIDKAKADIPAVRGGVAVVPHDKNAALRYIEGGLGHEQDRKSVV